MVRLDPFIHNRVFVSTTSDLHKYVWSIRVKATDGKIPTADVQNRQ